MGLAFSSIFAGCSFLFFIVGNMLSRQNFAKRFGEKYSFKNMFPFEYNFEGKFVDNLLGNFAFIISALMLFAFFFTFDPINKSLFSTIILIAGVVSTVLAFLLMFVPFKFLKIHIALESLFFAVIFILTGSTLLLNLSQYNEFQFINNLIGIIVSGIGCIIILVVIFNPKLSLRIEGEEVKNENGEVILKRPKWILLAFTEWVLISTIFINVISVILYIVKVG